jgi:hypothetical protein
VKIADTNESPTFIFEAGAAKARAKPLEGRRLLVLKGSTALRINNAARTDRDREERDTLMRSGVLVADERNPELLKFMRDHIFESASAASGVIKDGNVSGPQSWKNPATRRTLKDYWS